MYKIVLLAAISFMALGCQSRAAESQQVRQAEAEALGIQPEPEAIEVEIVKDLTYDKHTLADTYPYRDGERRFQWDKIHNKLLELENAQQNRDIRWVTLQNYKNQNGIAPEIQDPLVSESRSAIDAYGVKRYQSIPLYAPGHMDAPVRYGRDGSLFKHVQDTTMTGYVKVCSMLYNGTWYVPDGYVEFLETPVFHKVVFVDRTNQNITALEKGEGAQWLVRSMNPSTTGLDNPPYQQETPVGTFVVQEHKPKMYYLHDGTSTIAGYAPYASRFTQGGYIHGVPLNNPNATERDYIEFSSTLGTTPRSHLCVRTATSHAKFIYNWATPLETLVIVIE